MADALNGLIDSLRYGDSKKKAHIVPAWIIPGAVLAYSSKSTGKVLDVRVEEVCSRRNQILVRFLCDTKSVKALPFSHILGENNPLQQAAQNACTSAEKDGSPSKADAGSSKKPEEDRFLDKFDKKWANPNADAPVRAGPVQGPNLMPSWARRLEAERIVDVDSSPERSAVAQILDSSSDEKEATEHVQASGHGLSEQAELSAQKTPALRSKDRENKRGKKNKSEKDSGNQRRGRRPTVVNRRRSRSCSRGRRGRRKNTRDLSSTPDSSTDNRRRCRDR